MDLKSKIEEIYDEIVSLRREIHKYPEVGMDTVETASKVINVLEKYNIPYKRTSRNGIIADIKGKNDNKTIMLRGDMDALPQSEETGLEFSSCVAGKMHACGHDLHTSMLVGSAIILNQIKDELNGNVRIIFQPGEEIGDGALHMIDSGAMDDVDMGFGIHVDPLAKVGEIGARRGADWAAVDHFYITITGKGAHGATPQDGVDALVCAASLVSNLQMLVSRECDPMKSLVVTVGKFNAGSSFNIIAEEAKLEGTCRSFDREVYDKLPDAFDRVTRGIASAYGCEVALDYQRSTKPLINDDEAYDVLERAIKAADLNYFESKQAMIGEDFSEYAEKAKCVFAHLGADGGYPLHSPHVNFKEEAITKGIELEVQFVLEALQ